MNEPQFQARIVDFARLRGWMVQHSRRTTITRKDGTIRHATAITGDVGYPDLTLVRGGRFVFLELKSETGRIDDGQVGWLNEMTGNPGLLTVDDWQSRGPIPDGAAYHSFGGWTVLESAGDWMILVAVARPRHWKWIMESLT